MLGTKLKILFLSPTVPFPLTDGGRIRVFNLLKQIATRNSVTLLALETQPTDVEGVSQLQQLGIQVHLVPNAATLPPVSFGTLLKAFLKRHPITVARYDLPIYRQKFKELVAPGTFDLVHYEMFHTAQFHTETRLPGVLSQQNVDSAIWRRLCGETTNPFYKFAYWTQQLTFQRYERVLSPKFDAVTCTSDIDAAVFQRHCARDAIEIIPNGVDVTHYQPDFSAEVPAHLIYIGSMDWYPNEDAVGFFADAVLPRIQERVPDVRFSIVGGNPSARVQKLAERKGVVVTGRVPEIKPYFAEATVFVVPLRIGSGTRLKILEALAMGKAIVSTSVGAEGLALKDGEEIFIADEPTVFADAVTRLLTDTPLRRRIGENGRARVERDYDWRSIGEKLHQLYIKILDEDP
ncbi:MAG: glycosyltransferase family 4 protein [Candidatus Poribacteria bacterium]|nr:glycosyltransferase family 4 protein [Candidatus Poribacteria bacterium]